MITSGIANYAEISHLLAGQPIKVLPNQEHINALWEKYIEHATLQCYDMGDGEVATKLSGVVSMVNSCICYITALPEIYNKDVGNLFQKLKMNLEGIQSNAKTHYEKPKKKGWLW